MNTATILNHFGISPSDTTPKDCTVTSPIDGSVIGQISFSTPTEVSNLVSKSHLAFENWRNVPAPKRGELVRILGNKLRENKEMLAQLVTLECGKIIEEARGEVQEMIDICDFAVGLSRQLHGLTISSERENHKMQENWLPLGSVLIISAFNFPVAVWAWNAALALVCGNSIIWKPSEKTPFTAIACQKLFDQTMNEFGDAPANLSQVVMGDAKVGEILVNNPTIKLVSATGSTQMGKTVASQIAPRFAKSIFELGGNNAAIITPNADLQNALPSVLFGAVGTCGQRCTSTRRLFVHRSIFDSVWQKLSSAYQSLVSTVGSPLEASTLIGPLIDKASSDNMQQTLEKAKEMGYSIVGGKPIDLGNKGCYVKPALVKLDQHIDLIHTEVFAPILYVMPYDELSEAVEQNNCVPQGLSSTIFSNDIREIEYFKTYSDCGIANVNIGTSGAEIGGAFGGEKETGGGRESGSDAWKGYMRRQTSTTYYGTKPPSLAQGIQLDFEL